jgi:hypothetical protein
MSTKETPAQEIKRLKRRAKDDNLSVLGLRFIDDPMSYGERFDTLRQRLGDQFEAIKTPSKHGNPNGNKLAHSVVTTDLIDKEGEATRQALDRVIGFFHQRLD